MKVIILNYEGCYVEVSDVPMDLANAMNKGEEDDVSVLCHMGYSLDNIHWMFTDDEIPVFWRNEVVPYVTL